MSFYLKIRHFYTEWDFYVSQNIADTFLIIVDELISQILLVSSCYLCFRFRVTCVFDSV